MPVHVINEANRCLQCKNPRCLLSVLWYAITRISAKGTVCEGSRVSRFTFPLLKTIFPIPVSRGWTLAARLLTA